MTLLDVTTRAPQPTFATVTDDWTIKRDCGMSLS
ncbi:hypothetical protein J2Z84_004624 [Agrobacterium rubi]|nr:hypothetical protein [Agrobacterium rubi]